MNIEVADEDPVYQQRNPTANLRQLFMKMSSNQQSFDPLEICLLISAFQKSVNLTNIHSCNQRSYVRSFTTYRNGF